MRLVLVFYSLSLSRARARARACLNNLRMEKPNFYAKVLIFFLHSSLRFLDLVSKERDNRTIE